MASIGVLHSADQDSLSEAVFNYYNYKRNDRNLLQSNLDGLVHHHFGISGIELPDTASQDEIIAEIQRQETAQTDHLIDLLELTDNAVVYDVGCGRGGTMFRLLDRYQTAKAFGINLTEYQTAFCKDEIARQNLSNRAEVHQGTFLTSPFKDRQFTHVIINEVTPYALNLDDLFQDIDRVTQPGATIALATWCFNDEKDTSEYWKFVNPISVHYASIMHGIHEYRTAIEKRFTIVKEEDYNDDLILYWKLRQRWQLQSGVEQFFLDGHESNGLQYKFIVFKKEKHVN